MRPGIRWMCQRQKKSFFHLFELHSSLVHTFLLMLSIFEHNFLWTFSCVEWKIKQNATFLAFNWRDFMIEKIRKKSYEFILEIKQNLKISWIPPSNTKRLIVREKLFIFFAFTLNTINICYNFLLLWSLVWCSSECA